LGKAQKEDEKVKMRKKDFVKLLQFADVPDFDVEFIYEETFSPDGIANQVLPFLKRTRKQVTAYGSIRNGINYSVLNEAKWYE
jgi:hypothetical protein